MRSFAVLTRILTSAVRVGSMLIVTLIFAKVALADELTLGTGILSSPSYPGANERVLRPVASVRWQTARFSIRNNGPGLEVDLVPSRKLDIGPILRFDGGRNDDIEDVVIQRLSDVDSGTELGGYVGTGLPLKVLGVDDPAIVTARLEMLQEVANGHGGLSYSFSVGAVRPMNKRVTAVVSASIAGNDSAYAKAYFGISEQDSIRTSLPIYTPDAGLTKLSLTTVISTRISQRWSLTLLLNASSLIGDAADSPVVNARGTNFQGLFGLFISYKVLDDAPS